MGIELMRHDTPPCATMKQPRMLAHLLCLGQHTGMLHGGSWWCIMCHDFNAHYWTKQILIVVKHIAYIDQSPGFKSQCMYILKVFLLPIVNTFFDDKNIQLWAYYLGVAN